MKKILITTLFLLPAFSHAATLRIDPAVKEVAPGDVFVASVRVDVAPGECINAVSAAVQYPTNALRLNALSRGESIFSLWIDERINHELGQANFTAGIPGGYCGRTAGDPGQTNIVGKIAFQYIGTGNAGPVEVSFLPETEVVMSDGLGTKADLRTENMTLNIASSGTKKNEWLEIVKNDTFAPESFVPEIIQDTTMSGQPYFLVFDTTDKQSGVEHYELVEEDPRSFGFRLGSRVKAKLSLAKSPYILQDQTLSSRIVVRAFDHAGNMQEAIVPPKHIPPVFDPYSYEDYVLPVIIITLCVLIAGATVFWRKRRNEILVEDVLAEDQAFHDGDIK